MTPLSPAQLGAQSNSSQTLTQSSKRLFSSAFPTSDLALSKRSRTQSKTETRMSLPPLPPISSNAALAIFIHRSFRSSGFNSDTFGDGDRLAFLGKRVLGMVVADVQFKRRPMLDFAELESELENTLSDDTYEHWVSQYEMREKVACPPDCRAELKTPTETNHLFNAYVGALYVEQGYSSVQAWIRLLVDPNPVLPTSGSSYHSMGNPPPPVTPPPPLPHSTLPPVGTTKSAFLALFNQTAAQRGVKVEWNAFQSGPGHSLTWSVECLVDGISKGTGTGKSKQQAKEEGARQALHAMGWASAASGSYY